MDRSVEIAVLTIQQTNILRRRGKDDFADGRDVSRSRKGSFANAEEAIIDSSCRLRGRSFARGGKAE